MQGVLYSSRCQYLQESTELISLYLNVLDPSKAESPQAKKTIMTMSMRPSSGSQFPGQSTIKVLVQSNKLLFTVTWEKSIAAPEAWAMGFSPQGSRPKIHVAQPKQDQYPKPSSTLGFR